MDITTTSRRRGRALRTGASVAVAAFLLAACGGNVTYKPVGPVSTTYCPGGNVGGAAVSPALGVKGDQRYIFRADRKLDPDTVKIGDYEQLGLKIVATHRHPEFNFALDHMSRNR